MEYEDIIPSGLEGKTGAQRQKIIKRWEQLYDLKQALREGKMSEARDQLPEIEKDSVTLEECLNRVDEWGGWEILKLENIILFIKLRLFFYFFFQ